MKHPAIFAASAIAVTLAIALARNTTPAHAAGNPPVPVLVELFTSEGCSSCPPADALLAELDRDQFVPGVTAIVLSEHVTYWDDLGGEGNRWRDPYSQPQFTTRQSTYATRFGLSGPYTPQAVVDGDLEMVGSDRAGIKKALTRELNRATQPSAPSPTISLTLENPHWSGNRIAANLKSGPFRNATLMAALADDSDQSSVLHGENQGRQLRHVAVVRTLVELSRTDGPLNAFPVQITPPTSQPRQKMRLVVFLADNKTGRVLGAAMQPVQP